MAFSCLKNAERIYSFQYELEDWISLKEDKESEFKMPCCGVDAILKTSRLGTQFFAHKARAKYKSCASSKESPDHIHIKYLVSKELYKQGWSVEVEKRGQTDDGENWIADVYAEKGKAKIAIEVQWSPQSFVETKRRHEIYEKSGVRCCWLLRSGSKADRDSIVADYAYNTRKIPVFSIYKNKQEKDAGYSVFNIASGFKASYSGNTYIDEISLSVTDFVRCLVNKKLVFKEKYSDECYLNLSIVTQSCWRCGTVMNSVRTVNIEELRFGETHKGLVDAIHTADIDYEENPQFVHFINENYAQQYNFTPLRYRYSKTEEGYYVANSCPSCNSLMGSFFLKTEFSKDDEVLTHNSLISVGEHHNRNKEVGRWFLVEQ